MFILSFVNTSSVKIIGNKTLMKIDVYICAWRMLLLFVQLPGKLNVPTLTKTDWRETFVKKLYHQGRRKKNPTTTTAAVPSFPVSVLVHQNLPKFWIVWIGQIPELPSDRAVTGKGKLSSGIDVCSLLTSV